MGEKTKLQEVSEKTMEFLRGKYVLDEVGNGKDELKFHRGGKTVLTTANIHVIRHNIYTKDLSLKFTQIPLLLMMLH